MAMLNEVDPAEQNNHQGRLAYLEDELLPKTITGPILTRPRRIPWCFVLVSRSR